MRWKKKLLVSAQQLDIFRKISSTFSNRLGHCVIPLGKNKKLEDAFQCHTRALRPHAQNAIEHWIFQSGLVLRLDLALSCNVNPFGGSPPKLKTGRDPEFSSNWAPPLTGDTTSTRDRRTIMREVNSYHTCGVVDTSNGLNSMLCYSIKYTKERSPS